MINIAITIICLELTTGDLYYFSHRQLEASNSRALVFLERQFWKGVKVHLGLSSEK